MAMRANMAFESVDFTASRLPRGQRQILIQTYMAHHLGMSFLSLAYLFLNQPMQKDLRQSLGSRQRYCCCRNKFQRPGTFYSGSANVARDNDFADRFEMRVIDRPGYNYT